MLFAWVGVYFFVGWNNFKYSCVAICTVVVVSVEFFEVRIRHTKCRSERDGFV